MDLRYISRPSLIISLKVPSCEIYFFAALSSSRSVVVRRSVRPSVGGLCEKVTFRVLNGNISLLTYLAMGR